jgi:hypothetical protein
VVSHSNRAAVLHYRPSRLCRTRAQRGAPIRQNVQRLGRFGYLCPFLLLVLVVGWSTGWNGCTSRGEYEEERGGGA